MRGAEQATRCCPIPNTKHTKQASSLEAGQKWKGKVGCGPLRREQVLNDQRLMRQSKWAQSFLPGSYRKAIFSLQQHSGTFVQAGQRGFKEFRTSSPSSTHNTGIPLFESTFRLKADVLRFSLLARPNASSKDHANPPLESPVLLILMESKDQPDR